jgi:phage-related protein
MGQKYGPDLTKVGAALSGVGAVMKVVQGATSLFKTTQEASTAATEAATVAEDGLNASLLANPAVLIVAAIVAIIAIFVLLIVKVKAVRDAFKDVWQFSVQAFKDIWGAIKKAFDFVVDHWKDVAAALLALTGPPGLILAAFLLFHKQIVDFFTKLPGEIVAAVGDVTATLLQIGQDIINGLWAGIQWVWNTVVIGWWSNLGKLVVSLIGDLTHTLEQAGKDLLGGLWTGIQWVWNSQIAGWIQIGNWISGAVGNVGGALVGAGSALIGGMWSGMQTAWSSVTGWIGGLAGQISNLASGMFNGITNAFIGALNLLIDAWDALHFKMPDINFGPIHISGPDIGVPNIPHIPKVDTGGYIAQTGLAVVHRGENVIPAGRSGPAVHIEHAHFAHDLDVDAFMKRVAWHTRQAAAV